MQKKLYYIIDNGDSSITCELSACVAMIEAESPRSEATDDEMIWTISTVWLTDDEFNNLPEAD